MAGFSRDKATQAAIARTAKLTGVKSNDFDTSFVEIRKHQGIGNTIVQ
jgi:hypothetical protein